MRGKGELEGTRSNFNLGLAFLSTGATTVWGVVAIPFRRTRVKSVIPFKSQANHTQVYHEAEAILDVSNWRLFFQNIQDRLKISLKNSNPLLQTIPRFCQLRALDQIIDKTANDINLYYIENTYMQIQELNVKH